MSTNLLLIHFRLKKGKTTTLIPAKERSSEIGRILKIVQFLSLAKMNPACLLCLFCVSVFVHLLSLIFFAESALSRKTVFLCSFLFSFSLSRLSALLDSSHNGPISSQSVSSHHEMGDNKAPGGPTSLTSGVSSSVGVAYNDDPPGLHEKVPVMF